MTLPPGWSLKPLRDVVTFNPRHDRTLPDSLGVSFVPMPVVSATGRDLLPHSTRPLGEVRKGYTHFCDGDVLFAKITPCMENGKAAVARNLINGMGCGTTELHVMRPSTEVTPEWLYFYVWREPFRTEAGLNMTGTAGQLRVPLAFLEAQEIPVPASIEEQHRVTKKLDRIAASLGEAKTRLDNIPTLIKRFRQSILAAAYSGRLTQDWRASATSPEPAANFLQRWGIETILEGPFEVPRGWGWSTIGAVSINNDSRRIPVKEAERAKRDGPYPYYGAFGVIDQIDSYLFDGEFLLLAEDGKNLESRQRPIAFLANGKFWVNNHAHVLQLKANLPLSYLCGFLNSSALDLTPFLTGIDQVKLNRSAMDRIPVPIPPVDELFEIVRRVEALMSQADAIEARYNKALAFVDKLMPSILAKAFRGELT